MARLIDAFEGEVDRRSGLGEPRTVAETMERAGWSARDVADRFGVSERTARRWRQEDQIPESRRTEWDSASRGTVAETMERAGWSARAVADRFGVSERTARRWRQQDRIPDKRRGDWEKARNDEARSRLRARIERDGLKGLTVTGRYRISKTKGQAGPGSAIRVMPGNKITGAQMREVFAALDRGDRVAADEALNEALAEAYEAPGMHVEDAESLGFEI